MQLLKRKWILNRLRKQCALKRFEVCEKLHPFIVQYGLTFTENEIRFPQTICKDQRTICFLADWSGLYQDGIPFKDIVYMGYRGSMLRMVLRTGFTFCFLPNGRLWYVCNVLKYGEPTHIKVWWWKISGSLISLGRKLGYHCRT